MIHFSIYLSENDNTSLYISEGFAHGFCSLANDTILYYKNSNYKMNPPLRSKEDMLAIRNALKDNTIDIIIIRLLLYY